MVDERNGDLSTTWHCYKREDEDMIWRVHVVPAFPQGHLNPVKSRYSLMICQLRQRFSFAAVKPVVGIIVIVVAITVLDSTGFAQAKESVLYSFQGGSDGSSPVGSVVFDKAGNLYGATTYTSPCISSLQCGSVYRLSAPQPPGGDWTF